MFTRIKTVQTTFVEFKMLYTIIVLIFTLAAVSCSAASDPQVCPDNADHDGTQNQCCYAMLDLININRRAIQCMKDEIAELKRRMNERYERYLISQTPTDVNKVINASSVHPHCITKEKYKLDSTEGSATRGEGGGWCAADNIGFQYVQVTFDRDHTVYGVATQGREDHQQYVTNFRLYYSLDCVTFNTDGKTYPGNTDATSVVINRFDTPITGRCFRINPTAYNNHMSMRFDFIG